MRKLFTLFAVFLMALSVKAGEVTVADGTTTNASLPVCSYYFDYGFHGQMLYSAEIIDAVAGSPISSMTFYSSTEEQSWGAGTVSVKLAEVTETELTVTPLTPEFTEVYNGSLSIVGGEMVITFSTPFTYSGTQNLLLDIDWGNKGTASSGDVWFYGEEVTNAGFSTRLKQGTYTYSTGRVSFLPKTTFEVEGGSGTTCARPSKLAAAATPDGAVFTWEGENEQYQWCVVEKDAEAAGWALVEAKTYTASGLTAGKEYDFYVRTYCDAESQSKEAKVTFSPVCNAPANVEMSELTHNTATLAWSEVAGISKYQYLCLRADSTPNWAEVKAEETLTVTVDTLQPSTAYNFYVRSYFNAETQSEATKLAFTTNCVAEALPYVETFDKATTLPVCWEVNNVTNANWKIYTYGDEGESGYCLQFAGKNGATATLKTPAIELSEKALLKFYWKNSSAISVKLQISTNGGSTKTDIDTDLSSTQSTLVQKTIDLSEYAGETVTLYFVASNSTSSNRSLYLDELSVTAKPCVTPTKVKADASSTGAVVTWTAGSDESEWNLRYKAVEGTEWKEVKALAENTYTITGLVSDTEYEVQVQAACTAEKLSEWSASALFTPHCPVPSALRVSQITDTEALVAWDGTEATYNLQYREKNTEEWTTISAIEGKESLLTDLTGSTRYEVQVQSGCEGAFSSVKTFTTACAPLSNAIPFHEDFEETEEGALPSCWSRRTESEYPMVENTKGAYGVKEDSLAHCLVFRGEGEQVVILPAFDAALNARALSFFYKVSASVTLEIGYLTHLYGTIEVLAELNNTVYEYQEKATEVALKELPEDAKYLVIRYVSTSQWTSSHFDNISIADPSPTAVENTRVEGKASKRIENGVLVLEYNGTIFDATGGRKMN